MFKGVYDFFLYFIERPKQFLAMTLSMLFIFLAVIGFYAVIGFISGSIKWVH